MSDSNPANITSIISWLILLVLFLLVVNETIINFINQRRAVSKGIYKHVNQVMVTLFIGIAIP
jgi:hypothetical protein